MLSKWQPICLIHLAGSVSYEEVECYLSKESSP